MENSLPDNQLGTFIASDAPLTAQGRLLNGHQTSASSPSIVIKLGDKSHQFSIIAESNTVGSYFLNAADGCILTRAGFPVAPSSAVGPAGPGITFQVVKMEEGPGLTLSLEN